MAVTVSGCAGEAEETQPDDGPVIALTRVSEVWPEAIVRGRLTEREGCLLIGDAIAVFLLGTGWESPSVSFSSGGSVQLDSSVRLGGGTFDVDALTEEGRPIVSVEEVRRCARRTGAAHYVWAAPSSG